MKTYKECPRCGPKYAGFGNFVYYVYKCDDCEITFCSECSKDIRNYYTGAHDVCPKHVDYTNFHNTRKVGEYLSKPSSEEKKIIPKSILELRKKYRYRW